MDTTILTHPGFIGGMAGAALGLLGGIFGIWRTYRRARSRKERSWILIYAVAIFIFCILSLLVVFSASATGKVVFWIIYPLCLSGLIFGVTRHLNRLHAEGQDQSAGADAK
jgi:peptidoglycan/LPS O-acetylase OafA/YrhL